MSPDALRRQWRQGSGSVLARRRGVAGLALGGVDGGDRVVPTGPDQAPARPARAGSGLGGGGRLDEAYARLDVPDAVLGLASYAVTLGLAAAGGADRASRGPGSRCAGVKVTIDAAQAGRLALGQWPKHRAPAPGASWPPAPPSPLPLAVPEVMEAWNNLTSGRRQAALPGRFDDPRCGPRKGRAVYERET